MRKISTNFIYKISFSIAFVMFSLALIGVVSPKANQFIKDQFNLVPRTVLSTARGKLLNGTPIEVVKVKTSSGLFIEIYNLSKENVHPLIDRLKLPDIKDGFILMDGNAVNLAIQNIDEDNETEIIAPSFDKDLVAHLNVLEFNPKTNKFELESKKN